jgi:hypothetical protein
MNASPRNNNTCIGIEQLQKYHAGKLNAKERHVIEDHLLDCELCSDAVSGYALLPFSVAEIDALKNKIDKVTGNSYMPAAESKTFIALVGVTTAVISAIAVFLSINNHSPITAANQNTLVAQNYFTNQASPPENTIIIENDEMKQEIKIIPTPDASVIKVEKLYPKEAFTTEVLYLPQKEVEFISMDIGTDLKPSAVPVLILGNDTFIYDFKITDYSKYYFVNTDNLKSISSGINPAFANKQDVTDGVYKLQEWEITTTAQVLRAALNKFGKQEYANALKLFDVLIKHNAEDVNALFYGALCAYNTNNNAKAISYLTSVMASLNGSFYEEAKWHKALALIKTDKQEAKTILKEIADANGFYSKQAREKLHQL